MFLSACLVTRASDKLEARSGQDNVRQLDVREDGRSRETEAQGEGGRFGKTPGDGTHGGRCDQQGDPQDSRAREEAR